MVKAFDYCFTGPRFNPHSILNTFFIIVKLNIEIEKIRSQQFMCVSKRKKYDDLNNNNRIAAKKNKKIGVLIVCVHVCVCV